jgi:DNA-binding LacI/PurR family transcriptional regulator
MQDIARAAGVGKATVSLALRNDPRLRPETRDRIQRIAAELGYRANPTIAKLMVQLRASRSPRFRATLAFLNASREPALVQLVYTFQRWIQGCVERGESLGYLFDNFWIHDPAIKPGRLHTILGSRGIQGLIVFGLTDQPEVPEEFDPLWEDFPAVVMGTRPSRPSLHFCSNDQYSTTVSCFRKLQERGYRRLGMVIETQVDELVEKRFSAGFRVMQDKLAPQDRLPIHPFVRSKPAAFLEWYKTHKPDVIVTLHEELLEWLGNAGVDVPDSVGLVHLDLEPRLSGWAGMNQNNEMVGAAGLDLLSGLIQRNEKGIPDHPKCIMIESEWQDGATLRRKA